jgi:siroheme decarboxylase
MTKDFLEVIQQDLNLDSQPFAPMAEALGITVQELLERIAALKKTGVLKRYGARINHIKAGFKFNTLAVWRVAETSSNTRIINRCLRDIPQISHCYFRLPFQDFPFNLYTMIHGRTQAEILMVVAELKSRLKAGSDDYILLTTLREFKKTSYRLSK